MTATAPVSSVLTDELIARCGERAAAYDRENRFFQEDFDELKQAGYLQMPIPRELGGLGMSLAEVCREQRKLAYRAPATALATNMHLYWMGVAADLYRLGDTSLKWMLEEGAKGEVFAAGHGEPGNDLPLLYSTAKAERVDGGYKISGRKSFGSLSPVWTRLGIHAQDNADPANPKVVHVFMPRDTPGYHIDDVWDTVGMRATASHDTVLEGAFVPDKYVGRVVPPDFAGADLFVLAIFVWAEPTFGSIYLGLAQRALDLAVAGVKNKTSIAGLSRTMAYHPEVQHNIAEMVLALDGATAHVERIADDWSNGVDHGGLWPSKLVSAKYHAVETAKKVVDRAYDVIGGSGMFKRHEIERIYRDVRAATIHPANSMLVHEIVGKTALGNLGESPRWG
ncbi:MAG TPA: acyl-CoA dehydrogenase family protein [Chloroflexota bacterium]|nr:acyl-CoA dehydrogenase family protein [Chloroflexota bacterium]